MDCAKRGSMFVPYGIDHWDMANLAAGGLPAGAAYGRAPFGLLEIDDLQKGLRLNSIAMPFVALPGGDTFGAIRHHMTSLLSPWDGTARRVLSAYFDWVDELVESRREVLDTKIAPYGGLFSYADFRFSAPMPLVRAHLLAPSPQGKRGDAGDFFRADIAFFPGDSRIVAFVSDNETPRSRRQRDERLNAAGIAVRSIESFLSGTSTRFIEALCPNGPDRFWEDEIMPCGPFQPFVG